MMMVLLMGVPCVLPDRQFEDRATALAQARRLFALTESSSPAMALGRVPWIMGLA